MRKRPGTVALAAAVKYRYDIPVVPHLICGGFTREETENELIDLNFLGVDNLLVLRGLYQLWYWPQSIFSAEPNSS